MAIGRIEWLVVAISATAPPHLTVAVGTGKTGIKSYLLHFAAENGTQICTELVEIKTLVTHNANLHKKSLFSIMHSRKQGEEMRIAQYGYTTLSNGLLLAPLRKSLGVTPDKRL
jgi:hypothetical protein